MKDSTETATAYVLRKISGLNQRLKLYTPQIDEFCFIIGAMKSGTTTLYHYLIQHPAIMANQFQKESEFFSREEWPRDLTRYYRQYLPLPGRLSIALDASTGYTKQPSFPDVARRLVDLPGKKHFVYILRDPADRIESHIAHNIAANEAELGPDGQLRVSDHHIATSSYARQLDAYRAAFPDTSVKIVLFEDLKADPIALVRDVCRHLGIDPGVRFDRIAPQNVRSRSVPAQQVRLSLELREEIAERLAPDMRRLRDEYGVETARWGLP